MKSHITEDFRTRFAQLPLAIQEQARVAYRTFKENPNHPGLRFHTVIERKSKRTLYSVSIGIHYRALAQERNSDLE